MKYSEAEKKIKALSSKYNVYMADGDFSVNYKNMLVAWVKNDERYLFYNNENDFKKIPFSNKLYMILSELAITPLNKRDDENKYRLKAFGETLNINDLGTAMLLFENRFKTEFTIKEIEQLMKREDIPLDWNKVKLEEAN